LPLSLARCLSIGLVVLSGIVQRAELVGECVLKIRQRILHPGRGGDLCHPCLVLRDPQELRDTTLVVAGEGERIWNSVSDLHLRMIRRRRAVEKGGNETLPYASSHLVLDRCRKPFVDRSWRESAVTTRSREPGRRLAQILALTLCSFLVLIARRRYHPPMLFEPPRVELTDGEVAAILRQSMASAGRLPRHADVFLAGICAEHLVDGLRAAGLIVARPVEWRLHP
jgi:hypothetical protein